jgi:hemolysin III
MTIEDGEHPLNSVTHLVGTVLALAAAALLIVFASIKGDAWKIVSFSVYGLTLFLLYLASTLFHSLHGKAKTLFETLDHAAIYLLIAGTYTPLTLVTLRGAWGWAIFGTVWGLALAGIILDCTSLRWRRAMTIVISLLMGWLIVVAVGPLLDSLPPSGLAWLLAGGLFYSVGILFFLLGEKRPVYHVVWHLFVLAGSASHYVMILLYIL